MPDRITPNILVKVRPNGTLDQSDFAFDYSKLLVNFKLEVPLVVGLESLTVAEVKKLKLFENDLISNIKEAKLLVSSTNDFPIAAMIELEFLADNGAVLTTVFKNGNNVIREAEVDNVSGKTIKPMSSELLAILSREDMRAMQNATQVRVSAHFYTKDAKRYKMYSDYGISLKIIYDVIYENKL
jgi:hypothetical protein